MAFKGMKNSSRYFALVCKILCVWGCVHGCACIRMCVVQACMYVCTEASWRSQTSSSIALPYSLETKEHEPETHWFSLGWLSLSPHSTPHSHLLSAGVTGICGHHTPGFSHGCWRSELRFSCLEIKYSYSLRHLPHAWPSTVSLSKIITFGH